MENCFVQSCLSRMAADVMRTSIAQRYTMTFAGHLVRQGCRRILFDGSTAMEAGANASPIREAARTVL